MNPRFDEYVTQLIINFQSLNNRQGSEAFDSFLSASQYIPAYQWFINNVPKGSCVLDWGCGTGHFSDFLTRHGYEVIPYGFDLPDLLTHIGSPSCDKFVQANSNISLPFESESFDIVTSIGVLEHVREFYGTEEESLREINRVLKPGGIFFCFHLPNRYSWIEILSKILNKVTKKYYHEYRFNRAEINALCNTVGLDLIECRRYGFFPRNMLGRWPFGGLIRSKKSDNLFEKADDLLEKLFSVVTQNWIFCARKTNE